MFSNKFRREDIIPNYARSTHSAICFNSDLPKMQVVKMIQKKGIAAFIKPDKGTFTDYYNPPIYDDKRIVRNTTQFVIGAGCCSFTKTNRWYLFPFHPQELAKVGLTEDNLIEYIKFLNSLKCGFEYLYFGLQDAGDQTESFRSNQDLKDREFFWVGVPQKPMSTYQNYHYSHWIHLRYLINGYNGGNFSSGGLPYYMFPRIMFYLNKEKKLTKWRSFMYAYAAARWYGYYSVVDGGSVSLIPDLGIKPGEFKQLMETKSSGGSMNVVLTTTNDTAARALGIILRPRHNPVTSNNLFVKNIDEFIKYMDSCYKVKKTNISKAKAISRGKKTAKAAE